MTENNFSLNEHTQTAEELLGPPRIDLVGMLLMGAVSIVVGAIISLSVLVSSFFSLGNFSIESGVSPMILAMATFFALAIGSLVYLSMAKIIFPAIYTRTPHLMKHTMLYMIVLYSVLMPLYLFATSINPSAILIVYLIHILFAVFGIEIILGLISQYRYVLLSFYANIIAMILSGGVVLYLFTIVQSTRTNLFILIGLAIIAFFLSTMLVCFVKFLYYKFYTITGNDPLGSVFFSIEEEEKRMVAQAQNTLLQK